MESLRPRFAFCRHLSKYSLASTEERKERTWYQVSLEDGFSKVRPLDRPTSRFPTMVLNIDFKFAIPRLSPDHASRTVGLYSSGHFINDPHGRHSQYIEVWTAPCGLGEGEVTDGWRDKQVCLATSTQMALVIPMEVKHQRGAKL